MSVFTSVSHAQLSDWLTNFAVGELKSFQGISAGITNTNYFV
ncbi:MAG: homoserine kinase, partial [Methylophilaceae bacterium]|nr:homoserine kinase [Methylophilaceae bacterium]